MRYLNRCGLERTDFEVQFGNSKIHSVMSHEVMSNERLFRYYVHPQNTFLCNTFTINVQAPATQHPVQYVTEDGTVELTKLFYCFQRIQECIHDFVDTTKIPERSVNHKGHA